MAFSIKNITLFIALLLISTEGFSQSKKQKLQAENARLNQEIRVLNTKLLAAQKKSSSLSQAVQLFDQKINARNQIINNIASESHLIDTEIQSDNRQIQVLRNNVALLKEKYKRVLINAYKRRSFKNNLIFILSADNFTQMYRRYLYVRKYSAMRKAQVAQIAQQQTDIEQKITALEQNKKEKTTLLSAQLNEKKQIEAEKIQQTALLQKLKTEQSQISSEITDKQKEAQRIQQQIEAIIQQEVRLASQRAKAEADAEAKRQKATIIAKETKQSKATPPKTTSKNNTTVTSNKNTTPKTTASSPPVQAEAKVPTTPEVKASGASFASHKGSLPYPASGSIVKGFGKQSVSGMSEVYVNNAGVDIQTSSGASAQSVFEGTVTSVIAIPGGNKAVIIQHGNYFTVYNHLSDVYVSKGQKVSARQSVGRVFTESSTGKTILNFQVWQNSTKLNPAEWIRR